MSLVVNNTRSQLGGKTFQKLSHLGGFQIFCKRETGDKPEKGGLIQKWKGCHFFITLQFNHIYSVCGKSKNSFITFRFFSLLSQPCNILIQIFVALKHCIICIFQIHSGSVQKMLTALFKLVWNTQKTTKTIFFEYQRKMFLNIERVLVKITEEQL